MPMYRVVWEIDIEADSPVLAAKEALLTQRDPTSTATVFVVSEHGSYGSKSEEIDLRDTGD